MRTYYIPTSSLNFNNILSSESVSPKAFYQNRSFGYSRWAAIPENPFENSTVLYDQIGFFDRPKSDFEDHPLLIEVLLDDAQESRLVSIDEHAYLYDGTIYLDPFSTRILFYSENDKRIALSLSDSSIETKFVRLYQKKISVVSRPPYTFSLPSSSEERQSLNMIEIEKDKKINRMKSLLYGYYIGGLLSSSRDDVVKLNTLREIQNILAAILASFDHQATPQQRARLKELYASIQPEIPFFAKLSKLVSEKSLFDAIVSLVRGEYGCIRGEFDVDRKITQLLASTSQEGKNPVMEEINSLIRQAEISMANKAVRVSVLDGELVLRKDFMPHLNRSDIPDADKVLFIAWITDVLSKDEYSGKISTFKERLSDDVTRKAKEVCETEWKGSYPEITLNALRRHVRGDEFNHIWKDDLYSSIAAVIIRGDDWQKLLQYMQDKIMTDYRLAYSMYGTINGFANLPRDFTDVLFSRDNRYIADVYCEIYGQLFGKDILTVAKTEPVQPQGIPAQIEEDMPEFDKGKEISIPETVFSKESVVEEQATTKQSLEGHPYTELWDKVLHIVDEEAPKKKEIQEYKSTYPAAVDRVFERNNTLVAIRNGIESIPASCATSAWNKAKGKIRKLIKQKEDDEYSVFRLANPTVIESLPCTKNLSPIVVKRLNDCWDYTGKQETDVKEHIRYFLSLSRKEGRGDLSYSHTLKGVFVGALSEQVEKELYQYFGIKG